MALASHLSYGKIAKNLWEVAVILVLVPGMDGTSKLFKPFTGIYGGAYQQVLLPIEGDQSPEQLALGLKTKLPSGSFVLLLESFSSTLMPFLLASNPKGIIVVAGFLSSPSPKLLSLSKYLPLMLAHTWLGQKIVSQLCFNGLADGELLREFNSVLKEVPKSTLYARMAAMATLSECDWKTDIPVLYIQATQDRLVAKHHYFDFVEHCQNISKVSIDGPHFILQTAPQLCQKQIYDFVTRTLG